ncbi:ABC transporter permease [uncultured Amnibacterium sp.]|uniref:ABC transporter permease n=1 Tax=uncultured Amnibacterium sp. TaxID=1631851 RepID=UPI0035C9D1EB
MTAVAAPASTTAPAPAPVGRRRRADAGTVLLGVWGVLGFLFLFFPVLVIVAYSFNEGRLLQSYRGFGLGAYEDALANSAITSGVQVSIYVGIFSALVAAVLGSLAGVAVARRAGARWIGWLTALLGLVMVTPEIVNAVSLLPWFVTLGTDWGFAPLNSGIVRLIVAHSLFSCAVVTFIVRARMAGLSESLEEAAADLGAPPIRRFFDITFPLMRPAVISGALLSFTLSLDNTVLSSFVSTADATPFPVYVFASVRSSLRPAIAAMSTLMLLLTLVALALVAVVLITSRRRTGEGMSLASTLAGG